MNYENLTTMALMSRLLPQAFAALLVLSGVAVAESKGRESDARRLFVLEITAEGMTASVNGAPVRKVLDLLAEKTGVRVSFHAPSDDTITAEFREQPFEEGIRRLFQGRNVAYFYSATGSRQARRLLEVLILDGSGGAYEGLAVVTSARAGAQKHTNDGDPAIDTEPAARMRRLEKLLTDSQDADERARAAGDLGKTWSESTVGPLAQALAADQSASVREAAAQALGRTWSENAVQPLIDALIDDPDARVREQAARSLAQTADEQAVAVLATALETDRRWFVREAAALALATIGGEEARSALVRASRADRDSWVREAAALAVLDNNH